MRDKRIMKVRKRKYRIDVTKSEAQSLVDVMQQVPIKQHTGHSITMLRRLITIGESK